MIIPTDKKAKPGRENMSRLKQKIKSCGLTQQEIAEQTGIKSGAVLFVARAAVSGLSVTPGGATEIMDILGKEETLARLKTAEQRLF